MSDYIFMLESHLSAEQNRVVAEVLAAAADADVTLFLAGGAMRDMLGGFRIRDLDFTIEGNALKLAKAVANKTGAELVSVDEHRRCTELLFTGGVTAQIGMARTERITKTGARPQIAPAPIQEDLRRRDFTVNAIALSLNRASRGLLLDPVNGQADLGRRELRTTNTYAFYDDPSRLLRLIRLRIRLGFEVEERTRAQFENARAAELYKYIAPRTLFEELRSIAEEPNPAAVLRALDLERLVTVFSPALGNAKANVPLLTKLEKAADLLPPDNGWRMQRPGPFLHVLMEKLSPKERTALIKNLEIRKPEIELWQRLQARAKKLEQTLKSLRLRRPSQMYEVLSKARGDEILFLLYHSQERIVQDRIRNYFKKYVPLAQEITDAEVAAAGAEFGSPAYQKAKEQAIADRLDGKTKKPEPPVEPPPPVPEVRGRGR